jgi:large subunit ribosomal protein L15
MAGDLNLSNLKPAQAQKARKHVGRGLGSGKGRYSGRGIKGQKSRAGSHYMRAGFEGGQMPSYMRMGKQRGATSKDAMPIGPFRTSTWSVNVRDLEQRFKAGAEVTPEALVAAGLIRNLKLDVKILGHGDLKAKLVVSAHSFSKSAVEKIEAAGGSVTWLKPPHEQKKRRHKKKAAPAPAQATDAAEADEAPAAEAAEEPAAEAAEEPAAEAEQEPEAEEAEES